MDTETAEILGSDVISKENTDQVQFATFNGDPSKLYPFDLNAKNVETALTQAALAEERVDPALFEARRELEPPRQMMSQLTERIAQQITRDFHRNIRDESFSGPPPPNSTFADAPPPPDPVTTPPTPTPELQEPPPLRIARVTGSYVDVTGAQYYDIRSGTQVHIVDDSGDVLAAGIVTSVIQNEVTVEVQSRRGYRSLNQGDRIVIVER